MTTNHIEKIDPAIIRPGRIDINIHFKPAKKPVIEEIVSHYWDDDVKLDFKIPPTPHCKIVEICRSTESLDETIEKLKKLD
jgi:SpoVK/Ycf46/Vps4 family AAA+-type ATPase